jgi:hypothetical protein
MCCTRRKTERKRATNRLKILRTPQDLWIDSRGSGKGMMLQAIRGIMLQAIRGIMLQAMLLLPKTFK